MPVTDSIFLFAESREHPMHVGSLELFTPPPDAGPHFVADLYEKLLSVDQVDDTFRKRPGHPVSSRGYLWWSLDDEVDLEYHVRHSALPPSGRIRDLFVLISRLHGTLLDRHRPLWEMYVIEGIEGGRFAVYTKLHHSLMDGVAALQLLRRTLGTDPDSYETGAPWHVPRSGDRAQSSDGNRSSAGPWRGAVRAVRALAGEAIEAVPTTARLAQTALGHHHVALPYEAPATILNVPIGGARRFAAGSWSLERIARARRAAGVTVNDFVLAMCSGALRAYLLEQNALPEDPLVAMVPISLRAKERLDAGGNSVGVTLCNLGTDQADPLRRLAVVSASMGQGKDLFAGMTPLQALLWSAANIAPLGLAPVPGFVRLTPPPFNIIISNVPGPRETLYWNGARLDGIYPTSVVLDGQALNITLTNTADTLDFGLVGCRRSVPSLQRLLGHLEQSLADLETALGVA
ncbi:WS/DGAT/MGAT family O-acyltransferase [Rhodococcus chondri]|uniref:Diacylglycerol O-acyltransferase n=1 Tax=Rhodococcus chondri TaxID=3065941 RepID=A0ABU7JVJ6_9NOCA|nr:wax ester/triacylglycerol synthase family O-acyltransferase [Rhodococcus sp. CC-R104]MEE2034046.1 wax ester/triacylglycerol synthase family O-acyltransferase [Rhodococcus sp. CC-R104]